MIFTRIRSTPAGHRPSVLTHKHPSERREILTAPKDPSTPHARHLVPASRCSCDSRREAPPPEPLSARSGRRGETFGVTPAPLRPVPRSRSVILVNQRQTTWGSPAPLTSCLTRGDCTLLIKMPGEIRRVGNEGLILGAGVPPGPREAASAPGAAASALRPNPVRACGAPCSLQAGRG